MVTHRARLTRLSAVLVALSSLLAGQAAAQDASLEILTSVDGATVSVDGEEVATTPMIEPVFVEPGGHFVRVAKPGFVAYEELIVFFEEDEMVLEVELLPFAGIVRIVTADPGATVSVDGEPVGLTPFEGEVPIGEHTFLVRRERYEDWTATEVIGAGEEYFFDAHLEPLPDLGTEIIVTETTPFYRQWWFWSGAAVLIGGGIAAGLLLSQDEEAPAVDIRLDLP